MGIIIAKNRGEITPKIQAEPRCVASAHAATREAARTPSLARELERHRTAPGVE
jgi:hypothetical protein